MFQSSPADRGFIVDEPTTAALPPDDYIEYIPWWVIFLMCLAFVAICLLIALLILLIFCRRSVLYMFIGKRMRRFVGRHFPFVNGAAAESRGLVTEMADE